MGWIRKLGSALSDRGVRRTIDEEMKFHIEERTDEFVRSGLSPEEARREAMRRFGGVALAADRTRDADVISWLDSLLQDLRHAFRSLRRAPVLVAVSTLSLGLGIGLNLALYSMVSTIFFHR